MPDDVGPDRPGETAPGPTHPQHPRLTPSMERGRQSERYFLLLGLLLIDMLVIGLAGSGRVATFFYAPTTAAVLIMALRTSKARPTTMRVGWVAGAIVVLVSAVVAITGKTSLNYLVYFLLLALLLMAPLAIGRRILLSKRVTLHLVAGAICVYLMLGLIFTFAYLGINGVHPDFFVQGPQKDPAVFLYFSFVTITTTGFGDYTAQYDFSRVLVIFEAIMGQVFLVTTVARLVSLYSSAEPDLGDTLREAKGGE